MFCEPALNFDPFRRPSDPSGVECEFAPNGDPTIERS